MTNTVMRETAAKGRTLIISEGQTPIAAIGMIAIAMILAVHFMSRPHVTPVDSRLLDSPACVRCGTVTGVRRSAHSVPVYYVDVKMVDGSTMTVRQSADGLSVGDVVEVRGNALTARDIF